MQRCMFGSIEERARPPVVVFKDHFDDTPALRSKLIDELPWEQRSIRIHGQRIQLPRRECFLANSRGVSYRYSGNTYMAGAISDHPLLQSLMEAVSGLALVPFNAVFCNLYESGQDSIGWHRDDEPSLGLSAEVVIASVSFGSRRAFRIREAANVKNSYKWLLGRGDVLVMGQGCQGPRWEHSAPKTKTSMVNPRVCLTFRHLVAS